MLGVWLGEAIDAMYPAAMDWVHHPSRSSKNALLEAYEGLSPKAKAAYDADVERAFRAEHGASATVYRYKPRGDMGGASVSPRKPNLDPALFKAYEIGAKDALVHYGQDEMPLGGKAFGHEREIILRPGIQLKEVKMGYSYDRRMATRPIRIDKALIRRVVQNELVPQVKRWLERHPHPDQPIGARDTAVAEARFYVDSVDGTEQLRIDVLVISARATRKAYPVLMGTAGTRHFENGEAFVQVTLQLNGAMSPNEYLATNGSNTDLASFVTDRFTPLSECTSETCLPFGLYTVLIHETTHAAETAFRKPLQYEYDKDYKVKNEKDYVNDPHEVRAFMQQIVDETVRMAHKLSEHMSGTKLVDSSLRLSFTWSNIEKDLNARSRKLILTAVYQAFSDDGLL